MIKRATHTKFKLRYVVFELTFVLATPVGAYLGEVVGSFRAPAAWPDALAVSGNYLYVLCDPVGPDYIFRVDPNTGSVISSYLAPFGQYTKGLGYEYGGYLWIGREGFPPYSWMFIARCDEATGSVYSSFPIYEHELAGGLDCQGIPDRPGTLVAIISTDRWLYHRVARHTPGGSFLDSFDHGMDLHDPGWDYENEVIWLPCTNAAMAYVYGYTIDGSFVTSFASPAIAPQGAAYLGGYLWLCTADLYLHWIWKVHCPNITAVAPASLGRVKALFR